MEERGWRMIVGELGMRLIGEEVGMNVLCNTRG